MSEELAKKLKEARFPQKFVKETWLIDGHPTPTLDELIAECWERFGLLKLADGEWIAMSADGSVYRSGGTPTAAVAKLWLALEDHD